MPLATKAEPEASKEWRWTDDPVPDLGFDLDQARVYKVTTLERNGKGSLQEAIWGKGPRIVVFEVGGVINLDKKSMTISNPQIVIAGQTAPSPGITLIGEGMTINASQVLVQHLAVRPGDMGAAKRSGFTPDGITTLGAARDVWVDHCSCTWSVDECLSASSYGAPKGDGAKRIFFRDCLIGESLNDSSHDKGPHSKGTLVHDRTRQVAIVRCLYAANHERNPVFKQDTSGVVVNCFIAAPGQRSIHTYKPEKGKPYVSPEVAAVGNAVLLGPKSKKDSAVAEGPADWFLKDNFGKNVQGEPIPEIRQGEAKLTEPPLWPEGLEPMPSSEVIAYVSKHAGARPGDRDPIDQRIIEESLNQTKIVIDSQEEVGGYPEREPTQRTLEVPETGRREWLAEMAAEVDAKEE